MLTKSFFTIAIFLGTGFLLSLNVVAVEKSAKTKLSSPSKPEAESSDIKQIDTVLDQLEKDSTTDTTTDNSLSEKKTNKKKSPSSKYKFSKASSSGISSTIYGKVDKKDKPKPTSIESLDTIERSITSLEKEVETLASDVQKAKQTLLENSSIDNFVTISVLLKNSKEASITDLDIKLDGFPLYYLKESSGLWLPGDSLPLYSGPLKPGNHRLSIEARMAQKYDQNLKLNNDSYHFISDNFALLVPEKNPDLRYSLVIIPPSNANEKASASLKEEKSNEKTK